MERSREHTTLGIVLVALGSLFLLQNFGFLGSLGTVIWPLLFSIGGLAFLGVFITHREHWWALIPAFVLLGLAGTIFLSDMDFMGERVGGVAGGFLLGSIGMAFFVIYIIHRENWWALIPAGVLFTLATVATVSSFLPGEVAGSLFFFGLAATFCALYILPTELDRPTWALIPASILAILGLVVLIASGDMLSLLIPLALIAAGAVIVLRAVARRPS